MKFLDKLNTTPIITQLSNVAGKLKVYSIFIFNHFIIYGFNKNLVLHYVPFALQFKILILYLYYLCNYSTSIILSKFFLVYV